jgi:hypothetical protein
MNMCLFSCFNEQSVFSRKYNILANYKNSDPLMCIIPVRENSYCHIFIKSHIIVTVNK